MSVTVLLSLSVQYDVSSDFNVGAYKECNTVTKIPLPLYVIAQRAGDVPLFS